MGDLGESELRLEEPLLHLDPAPVREVLCHLGGDVGKWLVQKLLQYIFENFVIK